MTYIGHPGQPGVVKEVPYAEYVTLWSLIGWVPTTTPAAVEVARTAKYLGSPAGGDVLGWDAAVGYFRPAPGEYLNAQHYGAKPDGEAVGWTDSTAGVQEMLDTMRTTGRQGRIPAGAYAITSTLTLSQVQGWTVLGDGGGPVGGNLTRLIWKGAAGGTMLRLEGCRNGRLDGVTLDGNSLAATALDLDAVTGGVVGTLNTFRQCSFTRCTSRAVRIGRSHFQTDQSEWYSCIFSYNPGAVGVSIEDANSVWHAFHGCAWQGNLHGISAVESGSNGGHFGLTNCKFVVNTGTDIQPYPARAHSFVGVHSEGSQRFMTAGDSSVNTGPVTLVGCSVNTHTAADGIGIQWGRSAPLVIVGGQYRGGVGALSYKIQAGSASGRGNVVAQGVTWYDGVSPFAGTEATALVKQEGCTLGTSSTAPGSTGPSLPFRTPATALALATTTGAAVSAGWAASVWVKVPSGTVLGPLNYFYLAHKGALGKAAVSVDAVADVANTGAELVGTTAKDWNATAAGTVRVTVRMRGPVTLTSDLVLRLTVDVEAVTY